MTPYWIVPPLAQALTNSLLVRTSLFGDTCYNTLRILFREDVTKGYPYLPMASSEDEAEKSFIRDGVSRGLMRYPRMRREILAWVCLSSEHWASWLRSMQIMSMYHKNVSVGYRWDIEPTALVESYELFITPGTFVSLLGTLGVKDPEGLSAKVYQKLCDAGLLHPAIARLSLGPAMNDYTLGFLSQEPHVVASHHRRLERQIMDSIAEFSDLFGSHALMTTCAQAIKNVLAKSLLLYARQLYQSDGHEDVIARLSALQEIARTLATELSRTLRDFTHSKAELAAVRPSPLIAICADDMKAIIPAESSVLAFYNHWIRATPSHAIPTTTSLSIALKDRLTAQQMQRGLKSLESADDLKLIELADSCLQLSKVYRKKGLWIHATYWANVALKASTHRKLDDDPRLLPGDPYRQFRTELHWSMLEV